MGQATWAWKHQKTIPSSKDVAHQQIELLLSALTNAGWDGADLFHVQMAVEEALINAVTHGNCESPDKVVKIEFLVSESTARLSIEDEGTGFCPDDLPDPTEDENLEDTHGRGVFLIRQMMSEVTYNERGNHVVMVKHRATGKES